MFEKQQPSAFFGSDLHERLGARGIDTLIVCGTTTSGCVRATVVDGMSLGYRVVVPVEAVSDRARTPHRPRSSTWATSTPTSCPSARCSRRSARAVA